MQSLLRASGASDRQRAGQHVMLAFGASASRLWQFHSREEDNVAVSFCSPTVGPAEKIECSGEAQEECGVGRFGGVEWVRNDWTL
jgi:hypothetical protein